jgi:metaxin
MSPEVRNGQSPPLPGDSHHDDVAEDSEGNTRQQLFSIPVPIKRIFDRFPLLTFPPNELPKPRLSHPNCNRLFIFIDPADARHGKPSFNPQCLKWQV